MVSYEECEIEKILTSRLESMGAEGKQLIADYTNAKRILDDELLEEIKSNHPSLSDHGPKHIRNVLDNAYKLLGDDINSLSNLELYILCVSILFHDVGNFLERAKHNKKIAEFYDQVRGENGKERYRSERKAVLTIAGAHTGFSSDGSKDTISELDEKLSVYNTSIRTKDLASILRFADELAEGPQRTSEFMLKHNKYDKDSLIFHKYAKYTDYTIGKEENRIAVDCYFRVMVFGNDIIIQKDSKAPENEPDIKLQDFLEFVIMRINKVNEERQYCKFHSDFLKDFKALSVKFNFSFNDEDIEDPVNTINLTDLVIPDGQSKSFEKVCNIDVNNILLKISKVVKPNQSGEEKILSEARNDILSEDVKSKNESKIEELAGGVEI